MGEIIDLLVLNKTIIQSIETDNYSYTELVDSNKKLMELKVDYHLEVKLEK